MIVEISAQHFPSPPLGYDPYDAYVIQLESEYVDCIWRFWDGGWMVFSKDIGLRAGTYTINWALT